MAARKPSLYERARKAKPRSEKFPIPLIDHDDAESLARLLGEAKAEDKAAQKYGSDDEKKDAAAKLSESQSAFDAAHETVVFRGLTAVELDALANEFPDPAEGEPEPDDHVPFVYRLAVASAKPSPFTAEEWKSLSEESWNAATAGAFRQTVLNVNGQPYSAGLGKD